MYFSSFCSFLLFEPFFYLFYLHLCFIWTLFSITLFCYLYLSAICTFLLFVTFGYLYLSFICTFLLFVPFFYLCLSFICTFLLFVPFCYMYLYTNRKLTLYLQQVLLDPCPLNTLLKYIWIMCILKALLYIHQSKSWINISSV